MSCIRQRNTCARLREPQHCTAPLASSAHVCDKVVATAVALTIPVIDTGTLELALVPSPSSPYKLHPQHSTVPSVSRAQLIVVQVRFVEWTAEGRLRHAAFVGLRTDKEAAEVRRK